MHSESYSINDEESQHYTPQVILKSIKWTEDARNEEKLSEENHDENKRSGLFCILKILFVGIFILVFIGAFLALFWFKYKPQMSNSQKAYAQHMIMSNYKYDPNLYSDRVPHLTIESSCPPHNLESINSLNIQSEDQDVLFDQISRSNFNSTQDKDSVERLFFTNGFFNLTNDNDWHWIDPNISTNYQNFCYSMDEINATIIKAKEENHMILYIVKDYRESISSNITIDQEGPVCWQIYDAENLTSSKGFNFLSLITNDYRIACKSLPPTEWTSATMIVRSPWYERCKSCNCCANKKIH